jgi:hypothetical protein
MQRTALHQLLVDKLECLEPACHHCQLMAGTVDGDRRLPAIVNADDTSQAASSADRPSGPDPNRTPGM